MNILFGISDMEELFAPRTNSRKRPFTPTSNLNRNAETTMSSTTPTPPWMKNKNPGNMNIPVPPIFRTGIFKTQDTDDPIYQQPKQQKPIYQQSPNQHQPILIEQPGLFYDGYQFMQFLRQYERTADALNATKYDRALQIGRFVRTEELKCQIETMDGYKECDWDTLKVSMIESWGEFDDITSYTTTNLVNLVKEFSRDDEILSYKEFQTYLQKFSEILDYLVENEDFDNEQDVSLLFISAFPHQLKTNIKQTLINNGQLPKAPDGSQSPPLLKHVAKAAEREIRLEEDYCNYLRTLEAPVHHSPEVTPSISDLVKQLDSLKQQRLEVQLPVECKTPQLFVPMEPTINYTEPTMDYTEPTMDCMEPTMDYMEPTMDYTEPVIETAATKIKLPDLVEAWKVASANVMDTPMELEHTVIEIPEMVLDGLDTENYVDHEEILDQSVQQVKELDQSTQLNKTYVKFLLTENLAEDLEFPQVSKFLWIQNVNAHQPKLFNKQLFKPYLDAYGLFEVFNKIPQHLEHKTTESEENEETSVILPALGPSHNSTTIKTILETEIKLDSVVEDSIISLSHFISPNISLFRFQLFNKLIFQLLLKIPPDRFGQLYTTFNIPRILVGVG
ncbi:hypothetical protein PGT21_036568 [Puccinia graminis f. sp. tritici]|uniref:Uncharacterized protein n=1 Tax=Puccinia graminis f. sp. tritici TaxID=56615 RepID=A0A5B0Q0P2_PUCGR|nr:hypothetical protein PGT21_036568 [Puccinia graminis f. sp. tritici]